MHNHVSECFYDHEKADTYLDLIQSNLDRQQGGEQAWLLDRLSPLTPLSTRGAALRPRLTFRWLKMPQVPVPFLTWA